MIEFTVYGTPGSYDAGKWNHPAAETLAIAFSHEFVTQAPDVILESVRRTVAALGGKITKVGKRPEPAPLLPGTVE